MTLYRYWARLAGYVVILIRGAALERLLNLASMNGICLWNIRRYRPDALVASVGPRGYRALRPLLRQTHCRARIKQRLGWPFIWRRLARRPGFLCGLLLFAVVLSFLGSFVWRVEIVGVKRIDPARLLADLRRLGLYRGVLRGRLDKDRLQQEIALLTRDAAWIGLEVRGMVAVVRVVERVKPPAQRAAGDLLAARDGLVTKVVAYRGTPVVVEGETVRTGQLLISGREVRAGADGSLESRLVPASGQVVARVWDEARSCTPLAFWRLTPTGHWRRAVRLRFGRFTLCLGAARPPFPLFQHLRTVRGLGQGRNTLPLVELVLDRYDEVKPVLVRRTVRAATDLGVAEARALLAQRLPRGKAGAPLQVTVESGPGWVEVRASVERLQDIARPEARG